MSDVFLGYIDNGHWAPEFGESLINLLLRDAAGEHRIGDRCRARGPYIPENRNALVRRFLTGSYEWMWTLDVDLSFDPGLLDQLLMVADPVEKPVVAGFYLNSYDNSVPRVEWLPTWQEEIDGRIEVVKDLRLGEVRQVAVVGAGCLLVHRDVLEAVGKTHANDPWPWYGHDVILGEWGPQRAGEDTTFCSRVREEGFSIWGLAVPLAHHKTVAIEVPVPRGASPSAPPVVIRRKLLNVGGGSKGIPLPPQYAGWEHILLDIKEGPGVDVVRDARDLMTLHSELFDAVYCSHNLEHYRTHEVPVVLEGFKKVLKPDGFVHIRVPDLGEVMRRVADDDLDLDDELYVSAAGPIMVRDVIYGFGKEIEESGEDFYCHKTGFTAKRLRKVLADAGFSEIEITAQNLELEAIAKVGTS